MPSRKTVLNWSDCANFAPKETVTPSPRLDLPAIGYTPLLQCPRHTRHAVSSPAGAPRLDRRMGQKRAAMRRLRKLTGRRQTEWTCHSNPEDWMAQNLAQTS